MSEQANTPEFYADAFTIAWTPFGVDLTFGREFDGEIGLKHARAIINMSPQLADVLAAELTRVGEIARHDASSDEGES